MVDPVFQIEIDDRSLAAALVVSDEATASLTKSAIVKRLCERGVATTPEDEDRIVRIVHRLRMGTGPDGPHVLVKGTPPVPGRPGRAQELDPDTGEVLDAGAPHDLKHIFHVVHEGDVVMRIEPPTAGRPGTNVFGDSIAQHPGDPAEVTCGANTRLTDDGRSVVATASGRFVFADGAASVQPQLTIEHGTRLPGGVLDFEGEVSIARDLDHTFEISAQEGIVISGSVEGASLRAGGSIAISDALIGHEGSKVIAGEHVRAASAANVHLETGGDVVIERYCHGCDITCRGRAVMNDAMLSGGILRASRGVSVRAVGSRLHRTTVIEIGVSDEIPRMIDALTRTIGGLEAELERLHHEFQAYAVRIETLRGIERDNAEELRGIIDDRQGHLDVARRDRARIRAAAGIAAADLRVLETIEAGVEMRIGDTKATLNQPIHGPVRIHRDDQRGRPQLIATHLETQDRIELPSRAVAVDAA